MIARFPRRSLVSLCRQRLRLPLGARLGYAAVVLIALVVIGSGAASGSSGSPGMLSELVADGARWTLWLGVAPYLLAVAHDPGARDRRDGVEMLALCRGSSVGELGAARTLAAMLEVSLRVAVPAVISCLVFAAVAAHHGLVLQALAMLLFSLMCGVSLGGLAVMCGHVGDRRGRMLLTAVVLLPWALADLWASPGWSLPGAIDAALVIAKQSTTLAGGS